jgi:prepilin-type N-terminal cleavage/methylation domain-containing protein
MNRRHNIFTGFTLIELLACLCVVGVASVLVAAQFRRPREEKLAWAAGQIMAELMSTQSRAIADHRTQIAQFDAATESHRLAPAAQSPDLTVAGVSFDGQVSIAFDELGIPYSYCPQTRKLAPLSDGAVVVKCGRSEMTVRVLPVTGQIQVQ